jgi:glycosyltransferase involved in cell wall biosynthesis
MASGNSSAIRVAAFVPYPTGRVPGQRFRIEQWVPHLSAAGIEVVFSSFLTPEGMDLLYQPGRRSQKIRETFRGYARRLREIGDLDGFDVAYVYREAALLGPSWIERVIARRVPVIFDFDDAIYLVDVNPANQPFGWLKFAGKASTLCRISAGVVVGSPHLAEFARQHNSKVTVVPSSIDTEQYRPIPDGRPRNRRTIIGWMGSSTSQRYLEEFAPVLQRIAKRFEVEIRVISDRPPALGDLAVVWRRWAAESESAELAEFDVGIMPLPDTPWTRGKCAMKALQYMGMAVPAVCSPVGMSRDLVRHGENGLLAGSDEEWLKAIESLVSDSALRRRLGEAGRRTVEQEYSAPVCAARFAGALREAL